MRDKVRDRLKLRKLRASDRATVKAYDEIRKIAKVEGKGGKEFYEIGHDEYSERRIYLDEIDQINSNTLCREANRLGVAIPRDEEMWEESNVIGGKSLTIKGMSELRTSLRKEKNERWAYWELRFKVVGVVVGIVVALIGLTTVLGWKFHS